MPTRRTNPLCAHRDPRPPRSSPPPTPIDAKLCAVETTSAINLQYPTQIVTHLFSRTVSCSSPRSLPQHQTGALVQSRASGITIPSLICQSRSIFAFFCSSLHIARQLSGLTPLRGFSPQCGHPYSSASSSSFCPIQCSIAKTLCRTKTSSLRTV